MPPTTRKQEKRQRVLESNGGLAKSVKFKHLVNRLDRKELEDVLKELWAEGDETAQRLLDSISGKLDPRRKATAAYDMDEAVQPLKNSRSHLGNLGQLPAEIIIQIFKYMSMKDKVIPITLVCKSLRALLKVADVWENVDTRGFKVANVLNTFIPNLQSQLESSGKSCSFMKSLCVHYNRNEITYVEKLLSTAASQHDLRRLEVRDGDTFMTPNRMRYIQKLAAKYERFSTSVVSFTYDQGKHRTAVKDLISACFDVAGCFPNLKHFHIAAAHHYADGALGDTHFRKIWYYGGILRAGIASVSTSFITQLRFEGELSIKFAAFRKLGVSFPELSVMVFNSVESPLDEDKEHSRDSALYVSSLPRLKKAIIHVQTLGPQEWQERAISKAFLALLKQAPKLKSLFFSGGIGAVRPPYARPDPLNKIELFSAIRHWKTPFIRGFNGKWDGLEHFNLETMILQGFSLEFHLLTSLGRWHMPALRDDGVEMPDSIVIQKQGIANIMRGSNKKPKRSHDVAFVNDP